MPERNAMFVRGRSSRFEQRIFHARSLLAHGVERLADHRRAHAHRAQVANFLDFEQIGKRIGFGGRNQPCALPVRQLARREVKNSK